MGSEKYLYPIYLKTNDLLDNDYLVEQQAVILNFEF